MTHVVAFGARGGQDREVTNDSKAQCFTSKGGRASPMHDAGKGPCSTWGQRNRAMGMWMVQKCILVLRQRQHCHEEASDRHLICHRLGDLKDMDDSNQISKK